MKRDVGAELEVEIIAPTTLEFQIAVAPHPNTEVSKLLSFVLDGKPLQSLEISGTHGNRIHKLDAPAGILKVDYTATIVGQTDPAPVSEYDLSMYLRPSRYAEADKFYGFAATEFGNYIDSRRRCWRRCPRGWARGRTMCQDPATRSMGQWTPCSPVREFAATSRTSWWRYYEPANVPARVVSVHARGLLRWGSMWSPRRRRGEAAGGRWQPPGTAKTLGRTATVCDAADTAFLENHKGEITLHKLSVTGVVDGDLPRDSIDELVSIG